MIVFAANTHDLSEVESSSRWFGHTSVEDCQPLFAATVLQGTPICQKIRCHEAQN